MVYDYKNFLEKKILKSKIFIEEALHHTNHKIEYLENDFHPSKLSINSINFITKIEEEKLKNLKIYDKKLITLAKIIYNLINEDYEEINDVDLLENLYKNIFSKYKIDSMSK